MGTDTIASPKIQANTTRLPQPQDEASPFLNRRGTHRVQDHLPKPALPPPEGPAMSVMIAIILTHEIYGKNNSFKNVGIKALYTLDQERSPLIYCLAVLSR
jgi:hypothetical protein